MTTNQSLIFELDRFVADLEERGHAFPEIIDALYEYTEIVEIGELEEIAGLA